MKFDFRTKIFAILVLSFAYACSSLKPITGPSIYEKMKEDIRANEKFQDHWNNSNQSCDSFEVSNYAHTICQFDIEALTWLETKSQDLLTYYNEYECSTKDTKNDVEKGLTKDLGLSQYSDKSSPCLKLWFSEIVNNKIVVEVTSLNSESFSNTTLNFIYEIDTNTVNFIETFSVIKS